MGRVNAAWHGRGAIAKKPSLDERVAWHLAHAASCACRAIPKAMLKELKARGMTSPVLE